MCNFNLSLDISVPIKTYRESYFFSLRPQTLSSLVTFISGTWTEGEKGSVGRVTISLFESGDPIDSKQIERPIITIRFIWTFSKGHRSVERLVFEVALFSCFNLMVFYCKRKQHKQWIKDYVMIIKEYLRVVKIFL